MRKILLEWIWEVCCRIRYPNLFLHTCSLIDIYLAFNIINSVKLQLVGICAIFISVFFYCNMEISEDLISISETTYTLSEFNIKVIQMLQFFDYKIYIDTPDLKYDYFSPYITDREFIKLRDLILEPTSFGIIHLFDKLDSLMFD